MNRTLQRLVRRLRQTVQPSTGEMALVEVEDLQSKLSEPDRPAIIDVRGPDEFAGPLGHVTGALNIPLAELSSRLSEVKDFAGKPVILVCRTDRRSGAAAAILSNAGFSQVHVLRGGMEKWNQMGLPVVRR